MQGDVQGSGWVLRHLRNDAVPFQTWAFAWPGVPP